MKTLSFDPFTKKIQKIFQLTLKYTLATQMPNVNVTLSTVMFVFGHKIYDFVLFFIKNIPLTLSNIIEKLFLLTKTQKLLINSP